MKQGINQASKETNRSIDRSMAVKRWNNLIELTKQGRLNFRALDPSKKAPLQHHLGHP